MKSTLWRLVVFTFALLVLTVAWLIFEVPVAVRDWLVARAQFIAELWEISGEQGQ